MIDCKDLDIIKMSMSMSISAIQQRSIKSPSLLQIPLPR